MTFITDHGHALLLKKKKKVGGGGGGGGMLMSSITKFEMTSLKQKQTTLDCQCLGYGLLNNDA